MYRHKLSLFVATVTFGASLLILVPVAGPFISNPSTPASVLGWSAAMAGLSGGMCYSLSWRESLCLFAATLVFGVVVATQQPENEKVISLLLLATAMAFLFLLFSNTALERSGEAGTYFDP